MSARSALPSLLESFFCHRMTKQRNASHSTIASYRDALRMLILFAAELYAEEAMRLGGRRSRSRPCSRVPRRA